MRLTQLDGLRGIFSIMIVILHYPEEFIPHWFYNNFLIRESYIFVDFFFVLSGFVISKNYLNHNFQFKNYLLKRLIRLYPLLFFSVLVFFICEILGLVFFRELLNTPESIETLTSRLFNSLLMTNSTPLFKDGWINEPTWSISSEIISYSIFGIMVKQLLNRKINFSIILIIISTLILFVNGDYFTFGGLSFLRGLVGFFIGVNTFKMVNVYKGDIYKNLDLILILILIFIIYQFHNLNGSEKLLFGIFTIPTFFGLFIFIISKIENGKISKFLNTKLVQLTGKLSYSIYLNHYIIILIIPRVLFNFFKLESINFYQFIVFFITIITFYFYSIFTNKYIEIFFSNYLKNHKILSKFFN